MEEIYRNVPFKRKIRFADTSTFADTPNVVLFNERSRKFFVATVEALENGAAMEFTFSAAQTDAMIPGVYRLEIYESASNDVLLAYENNYAKVMTVAVATDQESGDPD